MSAGSPNENRDLLVYMLWPSGSLTNEQIGQLFGPICSTVIHAVKTLRARLQDNPELRRKFKQLKSFQFKALLFQRPNPRYSFKIFIAMQQDYTILYCDLGDATIYGAVDGDSLSP